MHGILTTLHTLMEVGLLPPAAACPVSDYLGGSWLVGWFAGSLVRWFVLPRVSNEWIAMLVLIVAGGVISLLPRCSGECMYVCMYACMYVCNNTDCSPFLPYYLVNLYYYFYFFLFIWIHGGLTLRIVSIFVILLLFLIINIIVIIINIIIFMFVPSCNNRCGNYTRKILYTHTHTYIHTKPHEY